MRPTKSFRGSSENGSIIEAAPTTNSVSRAETLPFTSSTDTTDLDYVELEGSCRAFEANRSLVKSYHYRQLKDIDALSKNSDNENDYKTMLKHKRVVWKSTQRLAELEPDSSYIVHVMCILALACAYATATATLMNFTGFIYEYIGGLMLLCQALHGVVGWVLAIDFADVKEYWANSRRNLRESEAQGQRHCRRREYGRCRIMR